MKRALITAILALILAGCMGNTINYITIENGGVAGIENHEDGNTNDLRPETNLTNPLTD